MKTYDTTLRDGTQSRDVSLTVKDKLSILKLLDQTKIDYAELGWPSSNKEEMKVFKEAKRLKLTHTKISAFCSTKRKNIKAKDDQNLNAVLESGAKAVSIFGKTWLNHITNQLKITPEENLKSIKESIKYLKQHKLEVFYDAEHFFDGYMDNKLYAEKCIATAFKSGAHVVILCDTNGGFLPDQINNILSNLKKKFKNKKFGIHCHNDSGCAVANSLIASKQLVQIQGTVNGFGERCGNADLCQIIPNLHLKQKIKTNTNLKNLKYLSDIVYLLANHKKYPHQPYVGKNAFSHKAGTHVDAIAKGAVCEHINPNEVGNKRHIVLSDLSGSANVIELLNLFKIKADKKDPRVKKMLEEIKEMENKGYDINDLDAEKYLLTYKYFISKDNIIKIKKDSWHITTGRKNNKEFSECQLKAKLNKNWQTTKGTVEGGPVDAAYEALKKLIVKTYPEINHVKLSNFKVMIAKDKGVESSVRVYIQLKNHKEEFGTIGVSTNIIEASIEAIVKGFRYYLARYIKKPHKK